MFKSIVEYKDELKAAFNKGYSKDLNVHVADDGRVTITITEESTEDAVGAYNQAVVALAQWLHWMKKLASGVKQLTAKMLYDLYVGMDLRHTLARCGTLIGLWTLFVNVILPTLVAFIVSTNSVFLANVLVFMMTVYYFAMVLGVMWDSFAQLMRQFTKIASSIGTLNAECRA